VCSRASCATFSLSSVKATVRSGGPPMQAFDIALFAESDELLDNLANDFYENFSGGIAKVAGRLKVQVLAEGDNGFTAAHSIICTLEEKLPLRIVATDPDLVDIPEIAKRIDKTRQAVQQWVTNATNSFPEVVGSPGGKRIWAWRQIHEWLRTARPELADPWHTLSRDEVVSVENWLIGRRGLHLTCTQLAAPSAVIMISPGSVYIDKPSTGSISTKVLR
jgi:hypothetical protein